jgi:hypothetical protein
MTQINDGVPFIDKIHTFGKSDDRSVALQNKNDKLKDKMRN